MKSADGFHNRKRPTHWHCPSGSSPIHSLAFESGSNVMSLTTPRTPIKSLNAAAALNVGFRVVMVFLKLKTVSEAAVRDFAQANSCEYLLADHQ
jgi:hypothetical protein